MEHFTESCSVKKNHEIIKTEREQDSALPDSWHQALTYDKQNNVLRKRCLNYCVKLYGTEVFKRICYYNSWLLFNNYLIMVLKL